MIHENWWRQLQTCLNPRAHSPCDSSNDSWWQHTACSVLLGVMSSVSPAQEWMSTAVKAHSCSALILLGSKPGPQAARM